ncbi:MAG TPA: hypothetical protein VLP43_07350 [Solirubrobacteraceae bacterium]|nr:hypothetical protein [Solirubrobacteraceae bacterium]
MGAEAGEVLAGGDLEHAETAHDQPDDERRTAVLENADERSDAPGEDRQLRDRQVSERPRRALSLGPELPRGALLCALGINCLLGLALRAQLATFGNHRARRAVRAAPLARAAL